MIRLYILCAMAIGAFGSNSFAEQIEIYCTLRTGSSNLECQIVGKERKVMSAEDVSNFIDSVQSNAYIVMKSKKGMERAFLIDPNAPQFKKLAETRKSSAVSVIARAKSDLFDEIEKRVIKISDELDAQSNEAELVLYDPSIGYDKFKRETRQMVTDLEGYKKNRDKICTATPAYEQLTKSRAGLQQTLSNILYAFQTPGTCMADFKVFKDKDGTVDLRQIDSVGDNYKTQCKK